MRVLKVVLEGITTSFRYPHFMQSVQPSYAMPPPATIYGHICSALGGWVDPEGLAFAYHFTHRGRTNDMEHVHVLSPSSGKLPGSAHRKVLEGHVNPFSRELLFQPRLVLYLNRPEWEGAFRSPRYPVVLGRSQDLCWYTSIEVIDLIGSDQVYLEHTLLPYRMATQTALGIVILMPRWLDYQRNRRPTFARYLVLERRVSSADFLRFGGERLRFFADPTAARINGQHLGLVWHTFTGDDDEALALA
jgi:CRISPR-associated protein Cas5t